MNVNIFFVKKSRNLIFIIIIDLLGTDLLKIIKTKFEVFFVGFFAFNLNLDTKLPDYLNCRSKI